MTVINREANRLTSSITLKDFGQAMAQLDLQSIPPEKRKAALMDHLMRIQAATIHDRDAALVIQATRKLRRQLDAADRKIILTT